MTPATSLKHVLDGYRVLDFTHALAGHGAHPPRPQVRRIRGAGLSVAFFGIPRTPGSAHAELAALAEGGVLVTEEARRMARSKRSADRPEPRSR